MQQTLRLRRYQQECIDAIRAAIADGMLRPAVILPTGTGKTVVFSHLIAAELEHGKKVVVLVHRDELAEQAAAKVRSVAPGASVGIVKAERNEVDADVLVCSVQTLARPRRRSFVDPGAVGLVIVDECHHAVARTWVDVLRYFGCFGDRVDEIGKITPAVGFTATLERGDGIGLGDVWQDVVFERDTEWAIEHGYLTDVRGTLVEIDGFDLGTIAKTRGDYQEGKLGDALISVDAGSHVAAAYAEHAGVWTDAGTFENADPRLNYRSGILFAPTVASAEHFHDAFEAAGIPSAVVIGTTPKEDRELIYKRFAEGEIKVLHNCMVLTEGFDAPVAEVAVIARPTQSAPLYTQMVGRVLRPLPGKPEKEALVLDVVGIAGRHQLRTLKDLTKITVEDGESLTEAKERIDKENATAIERRTIEGARAARQVELFAASHSVWLHTKGGVPFIPVRGGVVCLLKRADGTYSVGKKMDRQPGEWMVTGVEFEYALAWGEQIAESLDPTVAEKDRAWRRGKPSEKQVELATRMRLASAEELETMRRGAVSDLISTHFASRMLDKALTPRKN